jgi:cbb3-type cytochrome oxidase cytochrome c subunit
MAATDQPYRNQKTLDVVFAISSVLMLGSIIWMFADDYFREYKTEQRQFRDVITAMAQRQALEQIPSESDFKDALEAVKAAKQKVADNKEEIDHLRAHARDLLARREKADAHYQDVKAELDSRKSFWDLEVERNKASSDKAKQYKKEIEDLQDKLKSLQSKRDELVEKIQDFRAKADTFEKPLTAALSDLKKITDRFDSQVNLAIQKRWTLGDSIRDLPVIDAFASPIKINQITLEKLPIDYSFKYVTRFDRCLTCHQGIDKPGFTKEQLRKLAQATDAEKKKLEEAKNILARTRQTLEGLPELKNAPQPDQLQLREVSLTEARVNEFCSHPRLDLFVGSNSKHPAEKFGCTICHAGQGSATSFTLASHTPNETAQRDRWQKEHDWVPIHDWDFPMRPSRFFESSCLQCHHQVTDLISWDNRNEAPKLLRGYYLLKENGCFGCHEINGRNKGRPVGPDLRLEPIPPLEDLNPTERAKILADPDNAPGNLRKVGPSLYRIVEKTNEEWTAKWLRAPREFRPETKMPHFYGVSNNNPHRLSDELFGGSQLASDQHDFPAAEMRSIAYYLFQASDAYLKDVTTLRKEDASKQAADQKVVDMLQNKAQLTKDEVKLLENAQRRIKNRRAPDRIKDLRPVGYKADPTRGRMLFTEKGCLACHHHDATDRDGDGVKALPSEAEFGPNLSQVRAKLGQGKGSKDKQALIWLMNWVKDPHVHSPRSRMPVTHLANDEAADVAGWLLSQQPTDLGPEWQKVQKEDSAGNLAALVFKEDLKEPAPSTLTQLANVYLTRVLAPYEIEKFHKGDLSEERLRTLGQEETELGLKIHEAKRSRPADLKYYLGKKAVGRLGCFGCHDIPGFDNAKPIGVGLLDWGKKDPARLAFEDSEHFLKDNFYLVDRLTDDKGKPFGPKKIDGQIKLPYERFFAEKLEGVHRDRQGYLHLKVRDPRSFDYNRIRAWDDLSRMPQFRFARIRRHEGESVKAFEARRLLAEDEAREAVMTFVLGLVAEPIPDAYLNHPTGDRLAEVKGRQILEKYNCGGCHLIRPGVFDFKLTPGSLKALAETEEGAQAGMEKDFDFPHHRKWAGATPPAGQDWLRAYGTMRQVPEEDEEKGKPRKILTVRLAEALRFRNAEKKMVDLRASNSVELPTKDMIYPPPDVAKSDEKFQTFARDQGPFGGAFSDLLWVYLNKKSKVDYKSEDEGRSAGPPYLMGEGERVQPSWLYQFLLDPQPIRKMAVLRMPRFNMSRDEAETLVAYFAAVSRTTNPAVELTFPMEEILQQTDLSGPFWREKTRQYVARLKAETVKGPDGKKFNPYKHRLADLRPAWQQILQENTARVDKVAETAKAAKERLAAASVAFDAANAPLQKAKDALANEKDKSKKAALEKAVKAAEDAIKGPLQAYNEANQIFKAWSGELKRAQELAKESSLDRQQQRWEEEEAYVTDAFRLLTDVNLCAKCHQIGNFVPEGDATKTQGPPLALASQRLRPGWIKYWVSNPSRILHYTTMTQYFQSNEPENFAHLFPGSPLDRVEALRDLLMIFSRTQEMPVIQQRFILPAMAAGSGPEETKTDKTKSGDKK